jgi:hypothetical protein
MDEIWIGAMLICLYISGCTIVCLSEESKIWKEAHDELLVKVLNTETELKYIKTLRLMSNAMENENKLE